MEGKSITLCLFVLLLYWNIADGVAVQQETTETTAEPHPTTSAQTKCGIADSEYTFFETTQSCYKVHRENATWLGAYAACVREGGYLAVVNSQVEAGTLATLASLIGGVERVSMGFSYWNEGLWVTVHGQILSDAGYEKWRNGVPAGGNQRCGAMYLDGAFEDVSCFDKTVFICEQQQQQSSTGQNIATTTVAPTTTTTTAAPTTTPATTTTTIATTTSTEPPKCGQCGAKDNGYTFSESTGSCYRLHTEQLSWYDARNACLRGGGDLAIINSGQEAQVLAQEMRSKSMSHCHVGFRHTEVMEWQSRGLINDARHVWWAPGEPNNSGGNQNCGAIYQNGTLDDYSCNEALPFICECSYVDPTDNNGYKLRWLDWNLRFWYKLHTEPATWADARKKCSEEYAHLAEPNYFGASSYLGNTMASAKVLRSFVYVFKGPYKKFLTVNGQTLDDAGFNDWKDEFQKKIFKETDQFCGSMNDNGKLTRHSCSDTASFICEKNSILV